MPDLGKTSAPVVTSAVMSAVTSGGRPAETLTDHFRSVFLSNPDGRTYRFLADGEGEPACLTNAETDTRARAIAAVLRQRVGPGDRALIVCPPGLDYAVSFLACLYAGVVAVPVYPPNPVLLKRTLPRLVAIAADARPAVVLAPEFITAMADHVAELAPAMRGIGWLAVDTIDPAAADDWRRPAITGADTAFLQYTSGSTGQPRGVIVSHANLLDNLGAIHRFFVGEDRDTHLVVWLPPYHDMGLIGGLLEPAYGGFPVTFMSPVSFLKRPVRWLRAISDLGATISGGPNFAYDLCVAKVSEQDRETLDLSSLRLVFSGAEPVRAETIDRFSRTFGPNGFRRNAFYPCYGLAEGTLCVSGGDRAAEPVTRRLQADALTRGEIVEARGDEPARTNVGCGRPISGYRVAIVDPETRTRVPAGRVGEIWAAGPSVAGGYWGRPEETSEIFGATLADTGEGPFLRTGDLGFLDGDEVYVTGRSKDVVIIAGRNHYPQDIELSVESSHPALRSGSGVAFSIDAEGAEKLVVVLEVRADLAGPDVDGVLAAVRGAAAEQHGLDIFDVVLTRRGSVPKTSSGKVQRSACRAAYLDGSLTRTAGSPPATSAKDGAGKDGAGKDGAAKDGAAKDGAGTTSAATMKRAYLMMERLQGRIDEYERARSEPIAIIGVATRFPGGVVDPESYWDLLASGRDAVGEVPADRWDADAFYDPEPHQPGKIISRWGGFLDNIDRFDHQFFGISRREAVSMDPQHRLILQATWEALEDAGVAPRALAGSQTGVYVGICSSDYSSQVFGYPTAIAPHASTGNAHGIATGRVSYLLDLRGPSVAVDTACSSSLVAIHQACQGLRLGETDLALCGAVNVVLSPHLSISFSQFPEMLAADGRCKTFDASADGFVRSEGCGMVVLKRLSDALRDGDQIRAVIRGSAVNQDGRSSGLTAPNGAAQRAVLRRALEVSGVRPEQVGYIETHGAGTKLGDPIEVEALAEVYGRERGAPLYLGAVKTNLGHLEAASGVAALIKASLCLDRGLIPPNLHFNTLNPHITFDRTTFRVPTTLTEWPVEGPRLAGLSSFGFSGTNVHMILEQAPTPATPPTPGPTSEPAAANRPGSVLALSAKSETALIKLARRYRDRLTGPDAADVGDVCYSANTGRAHFPHRLAVVGGSTRDVAEKLSDYTRGDAGEGLLYGKATGTAPDDVVFLFTGQGPQRAGMARELYQTQPTFRRTLETCDEILRPVLAQPLLSAIFPADPESGLINDMEYAQPGLFAVEYALAELWRHWGVEPAAVLGHSLGEYAAACFAGAMSLEDGLTLVARRGRLLRQIAGTGAMAAIFASYEDVAKELIQYDPDQVSVAAVNGPANTTISGVREAVAEVCAAFTARGADARTLHISTSSHSALVEPVLPPLREALAAVTFTPPRIPLVSNLTGRLWRWDAAPDADYWCDHARRPVLFSDGVETLWELGYRTFLEVSPAPTLLGLVGDIVPPDGDAVMLPSLRPNVPDWEVLLGSVARLYTHGAGIDWAGFDRDYQRSRVRLPRYPFDSVRCWHDFGGNGGTAGWSAPPLATEGDGAGGAGLTGGMWGGEDGRVAGAGSGSAPAPGRAPAHALLTAEELLRVPAGERLDVLLPKLLQRVRSALGSASSTAVDPDLPLSALGLDSLMAVELRNEIQRRLHASITIASFLSGATTRSVAEQIVAQLEPGNGAGAGNGAGGGDGTGNKAGDAPIRRVGRVSDAAEQLLASLERGGGGPDSPAASGPATAAGSSPAMAPEAGPAPAAGTGNA